MAHHYKALTYAPKIPGVRDGSIRQTIRPVPKVEVEVGDTITFHGGEGKPYRSPWSWRLDVVITELIELRVDEGGVVFKTQSMMGVNPHTGNPTVIRRHLNIQDNGVALGIFNPWSHPGTDQLAGLDGIDPPTGPALRDALRGRNGKAWEGEYIIIRW